jgi:hypothetical protein
LLAGTDLHAQIRVSGGGSTVGYIDSAIPENQVRLRLDGAYNNRRPRRAEFFWAKTPPPSGPVRAERSVDYQDVLLYAEMLVTENLSGFVEAPYRFLNPEVNDNVEGLGDINFGFKYAVCDTETLVATLQFRAYMPTGDAQEGLGTDHVSLEPALLFYMPCDERLSLEGEFRWWVPIDGTDFAGDVLRYGIGASYLVHEDCCYTVRPVIELVGWTVLDGKATAVSRLGKPTIEEAAGDTIVNAKFGIRIGCGCSEVYAGYGRPLSGERWYENVWRLEWRLRF